MEMEIKSLLFQMNVVESKHSQVGGRAEKREGGGGRRGSRKIVGRWPLKSNGRKLTSNRGVGWWRRDKRGKQERSEMIDY